MIFTGVDSIDINPSAKFIPLPQINLISKNSRLIFGRFLTFIASIRFIENNEKKKKNWNEIPRTA